MFDLTAVTPLWPPLLLTPLFSFSFFFVTDSSYPSTYKGILFFLLPSCRPAFHQHRATQSRRAEIEEVSAEPSELTPLLSATLQPKI